MTKQELLTQLEGPMTGFTSIPVWKVIELLNQLEEAPAPISSGLTEADIKELARNIAGDITSVGVDLVEDYDLSMSYREVELDSVDLDEDRISKEAERAIRDFFEDRGERDID
jgi:hypothetical protein